MNQSVNLRGTDEELFLVRKITDRYVQIAQSYGFNFTPEDRDFISMDLMACHLNGNQLALGRLLATDDQNLLHDVGGIRKNIDRETGRLGNLFRPRMSQK